MVILQKHAEELFWLQRRMTFLQILNELITAENTLEEAEKIAFEFRKVENASDLVDRLKELYGDDFDTELPDDLNKTTLSQHFN
jgi:hypothetical protein